MDRYIGYVLRGFIHKSLNKIIFILFDFGPEKKKTSIEKHETDRAAEQTLLKPLGVDNKFVPL